MQFLFITNFDFYLFIYFLEKKTSNDGNDGINDKETQEVHFTNGLCLITNLTQFMQQTSEIAYD